MDSRQRNRSIDGIYTPNKTNSRFYQPQTKLPPIDQLRRQSNDQPVLPPSNQDIQNRSAKPILNNANMANNMRRPNTYSQSGSILNTSIPVRTGVNPRRGSAKTNQKRRKKWSAKRKVLTSVFVTLALLIGAGTWFGAGLLNNLDKVFHGNIFSDVHALFSTTNLKESQGRVNILLAGYQGKNSVEGPLTDSIMVVSIDPQNHTAFTMSIPRDIWVHIPGMGYQKINAANTRVNFNQPGYFKGGMGQLQQILEQKFGIPIDYYSLIDYNAFVDVVNAVGGITVDIKSPDPRGLYDPNVNKAHGGPLKLPNGPVHLNGIHALALALARGDSPYAYGFPLSDINRTQHQRQELIALEQKASSIGVLSNPITISHLVNAIGSNVKTNLSLADMLELAKLAKSLNPSNIKSYGLSYGGTNPLLKTYVTYNHQDALIPAAGLNNFSQIQNYYQQITSNNPVVQEDASVVILNASNTYNLAHTQENVLKSKGLHVSYIGNASTVFPGTVIIDNSNGKKQAALKLLQQLYPGTTVTSATSSLEAREGYGYNANFVVILGQNWNAHTSTTKG